MYLFLSACLVLLLGIVLPNIYSPLAQHRRKLMASSLLVATLLIAATSFAVVSPGQVGHLNRILFGEAMAEGQIIALPGQNGPQAETLGPGLHVRPLIRALYRLEEFPVVSVPNGQYGLLTAKAGEPLLGEQFLAAPWPADQQATMLQAEHFLRSGGQKGTQVSILQPGQYRLNHYLFDVALQPALNVETGFVAVVKSNVQSARTCPERLSLSTDHSAVGQSTAGASSAGANTTAGLALPLAPRGCVGVWDEPLLPGQYYLNQAAYHTTLVPTTPHSLSYRGGYTQQTVELAVDNQGAVTEQVDATPMLTPPEATGQAIVVTVDGWRIPIEATMTIQVDPAQAPRLLANVGTLQALEETLLTPTLRDTVRDVVDASIVADPEASRPDGQRVFNLITKRAQLEGAIVEAMQRYGRSIGASVQAIHLGEPAIPAELMAIQQRQELAQHLLETYKREEKAAEQRVSAEKAKALADQQPALVEAELSVEIARLDAAAAQKAGEGEKLRLLELGQVLNQDEVAELVMLQELLAAVEGNPDMIKVPTVYVAGEHNSLAGPAAILGASNWLQWISNSSTETQKTQGN